MYAFLVEAGAHVVHGRLEAGVEDGVVEWVGRGREEGAQEAQGVPHTDITARQFSVILRLKHITVESGYSDTL